MGNLTNAQKSIWVTEQYYKGSSINNICMKYIQGNSDEEEIFPIFYVAGSQTLPPPLPEEDDSIILGPEQPNPAEIEIEKLITFNQEGKYISISYNNFNEGEEYLDIIKEKDI